MENKIPGLLRDDRSEELKARDYKSNNPELAGAGAVIWQEKLPNDWKHWSARYQISSSSCVGQSFAKAMQILYGGVPMSALPIYRNRKNYPSPGAWMYDAGDIAKKIGTGTEAQIPSQFMTEQMMNVDLTQGTLDILKKNPIKIGAYVYVDNHKDIENIARTIQEQGHCILTVESSNQEWTSIPEVKGNITWGHCIVGVDITLYQGKEYIVIEDTLGSNEPFGERKLLSKEFIKARCTGAMYLLPYTPPQPVSYVFFSNLKKGDKGEVVQKLQERLKKLGFFPNIQTTQFYGAVTSQALLKFQLAYKVDTPAVLNSLKGEVFGPKTRKKLNEII